MLNNLRILEIHKNEDFRKLFLYFFSQILILGHFWEPAVHFSLQLYQNLNLALIFLKFSKLHIFKTKKDTDFSFVAFQRLDYKPSRYVKKFNQSIL